MKCKNGFTLLELLIAAAIIGALAIFATANFRHSAARVRVQDAIGRAKIVAMAARQFVLDHPAAKNATGTNLQLEIGTVSAPSTNSCSAVVFSVQNLIDCGYLDFKQYASELYQKNDDTGVFEHKSHFAMQFSSATGSTVSTPVGVCFVGTSTRVLGTDTNVYWTDGEIVCSESKDAADNQTSSSECNLVHKNGICKSLLGA